ncbi:uncharacterized protein LOC120202215 [Hibiscus syriacus]|uniref:uncharacterized protein LOC120202215 n=1 Tax=Hibiscus syriacus TaxID=106335 RepID=UPI001924E01E|nr:uncharacterized protein LOC120202215 [Hibiscus syriacus]
MSGDFCSRDDQYLISKGFGMWCKRRKLMEEAHGMVIGLCSIPFSTDCYSRYETSFPTCKDNSYSLIYLFSIYFSVLVRKCVNQFYTLLLELTSIQILLIKCFRIQYRKPNEKKKRVIVAFIIHLYI